MNDLYGVMVGIGFIIVAIIGIVNTGYFYRNRTWKECLTAMESRLNFKINEIKTDLNDKIDKLEERMWEEKRGG